MIVCLDVDYRRTATVAACVAFKRWTDDRVAFERSREVSGAPAPYVPGSFYLRELPTLLAILKTVPEAPSTLVIDGYVTLGPGRPGLGARLHEALGSGVVVVGVAKTAFRGATHAVSVLRGASRKPLFVTAAGMSVVDAAERIRAMDGAHRIPTMIRRADRLCREA
jgi:deoxyribonuclease V